MDFHEKLMAEIAKSAPTPYSHDEGSVVRVLKRVIQDGQTPRAWAGARARVIGRRTTILHKEHWYELSRLPDGATEWFGEHELDRRYGRRTRWAHGVPPVPRP